MSLADIKIPADASDKQTTDARSAKPPAEFSVVSGAGNNAFSITDRQGPAERVPTVSYRIYFLPEKFAPTMNGVMATTRVAASKVASLVAEVSAPGRGGVLTATDSVNVGAKGYYYCVAVNRVGIEAPPENIVKAP